MYAAASFLNASSSAGTNPWLTQTVAVVAAALAMYGLLSVAAAASPREPRSIDLRLYLSIPITLPCRAQPFREHYRFRWYDVGKQPALMFANGLSDVNDCG